jgi:hypothetical protein
MPFIESIRQHLATTVGGKCSAPHCRRVTGTPQGNRFGIGHIGEGAHIRGSREGAPRFDMSQPDIERESESNGIWLCPTCHTQIDKYPAIYGPALLHHWKSDAISRYMAELAGQPENDGSYLHENELTKARQFLASQQEIYWKLAEFVRNRPYVFGHTKFIFPEKIKSEVGFYGGVFRSWNWNNKNLMWAFSISIRRWENELLRICHLMSSDPRMQSFESSTVVDVSTTSGSNTYIDPLMQAAWSYVETYEQFVNFINGF